MSATIVEKPTGRGKSGSQNKLSNRFEYLAIGATDQEDAYTALAAGTATSINGGLQTRLTLEAKETDAAGVFDCAVTYEYVNAQPKQTGETAFNFDTTGGTTKVTHSLATVASYPAADGSGDGGAPDFHGVLNVANGKAAGVEITIPQLAFTGTRYVSTITETYIGQLFHATGTVNNGDLTMVIDGITLTFSEAEVLFLGVNGSRRGGGDVELGLKYAASETLTSITIGDITGITKRGWDYLWVYSVDDTESADDADGNSIDYVFPKPAFVYIEQLYEETDFTVHGFPTS